MNANPEICFITTCMGRLAHLRQSLERAVAQPRASQVVVDYSCPEQCGDWVERSFPFVTVVRVPGAAHFQLARARNLGARAASSQAATAPWLCFLDADILLAPSFTEAVVPLLQPGSFYLASPWNKVLCGTMICARKGFDGAGGYDERIQGWGCEDEELYSRFRLFGMTPATFPASLLGPIQHGDDLRVQFYRIKDWRVSHTVNWLYMRAKLDLMKLSGQHPSPQTLQLLYERVEACVRQAQQSGQEASLQIDLPEHLTPAGWQAATRLTYVINRPPSSPGGASTAE